MIDIIEILIDKVYNSKILNHEAQIMISEKREHALMATFYFNVLKAEQFLHTFPPFLHIHYLSLADRCRRTPPCMLSCANLSASLAVMRQNW